MRRRMIFLTMVAFGLLAAWSVGWKLVAGRIEAALQQLPARAAAQGWELSPGGGRIGGWPWRFELVSSRPRLAASDGRAAWEGPERVELVTLAYNPTHLIAFAPGTHHLLVGGARWRLQLAQAESSLRLVGLTTAVPERWVLVTRGIALAPEGVGEDAALELQELRVASRLEGDARHHGVAAEALGLRLPPQAALPGLPAEVTALRLDARPELSAPLDLARLGRRLPGVVALEIREASLVWGPVRLIATGRIRADAAGRAAGRLEVTVRAFRPLLAALEAGGLIAPGRRQLLEGALAAMAGASPGTPSEAEEARVPLTLSGGEVRLGPIVLGPAPRLPGFVPSP